MHGQKQEPGCCSAASPAATRIGSVGRSRGSKSFWPLPGPGELGHEQATANLASALVVEFELTGRGEALATAITILEDAEPGSAKLGDREADFFAVLGHALLRDAERTGLAATAARAVAARRKALDLTSRRDAAYPGRLSDLGAVLAIQFRFAGDLAVLQEAISVHRAAMRGASPDDASFSGRLSSLGTSLDELGIRKSATGLLQQAVDVQRKAVEAAMPGDPLRPMIISNLGNSLEHLYEETGSRAALDEAIARHREAVAATPEEHIEHYRRQTNLAVALQSLYERTGDLTLLDEAIDIFRYAVHRTPEDYANRFRYLHGMSSALMRLAERTGDLSGVDEAISLWSEVVDATPADHPAKPGRLSALATARFLRFQRDPSDLAPLDTAITELRQALGIIPDGHAQQPMLRSNLGAVLVSRFEHTENMESLEDALVLHQQAVDATPSDHSDRAAHLSNFGIALLLKARRSENETEANRAVAVLDEALDAIGSDDPRRALTLHVLGASYARLSELGDVEALGRGVTVLAEAAGMDIAPAAVRIQAGRDRGRLAATGGLYEEALEGFANAVRLMEETAWTGMNRIDQQRLLTELNGLPMEAAAMAIETDRLEEAVELLEQGRGILLARQLETPGLYAQLQSRAPDLAEELAWVENALDPTARDDNLIDSGSNLIPDPQVAGQADRRSRLARQRAAILDKIRKQSTLQDLVEPPRFDGLSTAAERGPVVIVNVSQYRCDALIISDGHVRLVPLADLTAAAVAEQVEKLRIGADAASRTQVNDVLSWTWNCIVEPVFSDLGLTGSVPVGEEIHVWWCATGLSSFLPLHAAGDHPNENRAGRNALDLAISSFTPTLRILLRLRDRQPGLAGSDSGPLVVAMPQTPGLNDLESPEREVAYLAERLASLAVLKGAAATRDAVAEAMTRHRWAHFSCHGSQDLRQPYRAALHLHDGPLAAPQIMGLELPNPSFAYLSACDTSRGGTSIPDESITITSALQIAGYQHVIGTLWPISGLTASEIAQGVYEQIMTEHDGVIDMDFDGAATALRSAVRTVRDASPELPALYWAAYIHTGP